MGNAIITVIWNDRYCDGDQSRSQELELEMTIEEVRQASVDTLVRLAMMGYYKEGHTATKVYELTNEAMQSYGLVGVINGAVEWLH